nr:GGDEF domain-containing protein [Sedimentibacter sp.]
MSFSSKQEVLDSISKFEGLYDVVRIVDPVKKSVEGRDGTAVHTHCYDFWEKGTPCENCVTSRALVENNTFHKIEFKKGIIYLITSCPVQVKEDTYALELLKDITDTGIIEDDSVRSDEELEKSIEHLNKKLVVDELTGTYNRRFINERLPADMFFAEVNKTKLSLIMMDVDNFKQINDSYSHMAGDLILKQVSEIMISSVRKKIDWVARFGGDEFLICLNGANEAAAARIAEAIRQSVEKTAVEYNGNKIKTSLSIGIYTLDKEDITAEELLRRVDMNMYEAKKMGKNAIFSR